MRYHLKYLATIALVLMAGFQAFLAYAEPLFHSREQKFTIAIPNELEAVSNNHPAVGLALRAKTADFPSFNVVVEPGQITEQMATLATQAELIIQSYRQLGFNNVELISSKVAKFAQNEAFLVECSYSNRGERYLAAIAVINGKTRHYTLTYIDRAERYEVSLKTRASLFESFTLEPTEHNSNELPLPAKYRIFWVALAIFIIAGLALVLARGKLLGKLKFFC